MGKIKRHDKDNVTGVRMLHYTNKYFGKRCDETPEEHARRRRNEVNYTTGKHRSHRVLRPEEIMANFTTYVPAPVTRPRG